MLGRQGKVTLTGGCRLGQSRGGRAREIDRKCKKRTRKFWRKTRTGGVVAKKKKYGTLMEGVVTNRDSG